jgi:hypothetical protein
MAFRDGLDCNPVAPQFENVVRPPWAGMGDWGAAGFTGAQELIECPSSAALEDLQRAIVAADAGLIWRMSTMLTSIVEGQRSHHTS